MIILVKSAIVAAAQMLGIAEEVNRYFDGEESVDGQRDAELLLKCFNHVENELALDYLPMLVEDEIVSPTGFIYYDELTEMASRIYSVENDQGDSIPFKLFPEHLETQAGKVKVIYAYIPSEKDLDGESSYVTMVSVRLFAYGMAAEYALAKGELETASVWDKKYKDAVAAAYKSRPVKRLRSRRWV